MTNLVDLARTLKHSDEITLLRYLNELEDIFEEREPNVLAFVPQDSRFARLKCECQALLTKHPDPRTRPPLFGVPVGVKDIFHADSFVTRAGSALPYETLQGQEAETVSRLRAAGAVIMGKTVTTEFAYFAPGTTRNPHNLEHTPGGSSSGSAAAVGALICPLTLGTQTIGSITRPAAFCGAVGYKPTYERISRAGVIPLAPSVDHVGLFATDVAGARLGASVIVEEWDVNQANNDWHLPRLGIPEGPYLQHASVEGLRHLQEVCSKLTSAGIEITTIPAILDFKDVQSRHNLIVAAEAARVHSDWYSRHSSLYQPKTVELIKQGAAISHTDLKYALRGRAKLRNELTQLMDDHRVDLWMSPSATGTAPKGLTNTGNPVMNLPWTHSGLPTLSLPSGKGENNLPLGMQLAARFCKDEALFGWVAKIEEVL